MIRRFLRRLVPALAARRQNPTDHLPMHDGTDLCVDCLAQPGQRHTPSCRVTSLDQYEAFLRAVFGGKR